ncbi:hypothetical protein CKF58_03620 [Psittacicella hinzii]|uniref:Capsular polysaccharide export protein n=2 Tax=Psittacicella hinzii TaxID=2028575 RepID=A0A3A1YKB1_9GAMM|nr:hypothetical protein CKF58_03620 [Psittacicella hinzii]
MPSSRRQARSFMQVFTAAYIQYPRYLNPYTQELGNILEVIDYLAHYRTFNELLRGEVYAFNMSWWKRQVVKPFVRFPSCNLNFAAWPKQQCQIIQAQAQLTAHTANPISKTSSEANHIATNRSSTTDSSTNSAVDATESSTNNSTSQTVSKQLSSNQLVNLALPQPQVKLLLWGTGKPEVLAWAQKQNLSVISMEDGFIRSVGLGSNLVAPLSLVLDDQGIYFNAQQASRLEQILNTAKFSNQELEQAESLRQQLIATNIGKYNVGQAQWQINPQQGQKVILVPGQVEDDASIRTGSPEVKTNLGLLQQVRENNPYAYIIYKPHPDVEAKNRVGAIAPEIALQYANTIASDINILSCIALVDEVHTMTSLAGFEALIRGKTVHCYGLPFYAGWGLTVDKLTTPRRNMRRSVAELVAATLTRYPLYVHPFTKQLLTPQQAITWLEQQRQQAPAAVKQTWLARKWGQLKHLWRCWQ